MRSPSLAASLLAVSIVVVAVIGLTMGPVTTTLGDVLKALMGEAESQVSLAVLSIRLPRLILGIVVGAALALSGVLMQGLFRNALADPGLVGISAGAAFAAALALVLGSALGASAFSIYLLPIAAFAGSLVVTFAVFGLATRGGTTSIPIMLLAGIAINTLCGAGIGLVIFTASATEIRDIIFWTLGSLEVLQWNEVLIVCVIVVPAIIVSLRLARGLNGFLLGEAEAFNLGVNVQAVKRSIIVLTALMVGVSVSIVGIIGFVGLVIPHIIRLWLGPDHKVLIPVSALAGALLLVAADLVARAIIAPSELPIGILTALLGAPFFLWLLLRERASIRPSA